MQPANLHLSHPPPALLLLGQIALDEQGKAKDAQVAYAKAQELLDERLAMQQASGTWHHDDLISLIFKDEVDAKRKPRE